MQLPRIPEVVPYYIAGGTQRHDGTRIGERQIYSKSGVLLAERLAGLARKFTPADQPADGKTCRADKQGRKRDLQQYTARSIRLLAKEIRCIRGDEEHGRYPDSKRHIAETCWPFRGPRVTTAHRPGDHH